jgi:hypothetical protein
MSNYDVRILVNGNNCRQYYHNGKTFIEAKDGSEYCIEIKNNTWKRILACCSVDGLNILDGEPSTPDGPGYVISAHASNRYDGFRVSDSTIAKFIFGKKSESYAASKEDGSERNVGVIGVRIFEEKSNHYYSPLVIRSYGCNSKQDNINIPPIEFPPTICSTGTPLPPNPIVTCCSVNDVNDNLIMDKSQAYSNYNAPKFDMGTMWGEAKESKVVEVEFARGSLSLSLDIYYASRQNLIDMGVPIGTEKHVNFPSPFVEKKYATPPKNWRG